MAAYRGRLDAPVLIGVGAAFDFMAGTVRRAPRFLQYNGFEWAYRMVQEPRRLWKRYVFGNSRFVMLLLMEKWERCPDRKSVYPGKTIGVVDTIKLGVKGRED
jgi:UDP-N-acetyl-D-mannosaminuronic acid transferase (WecB/TagA/CpsF family)